MTEQSAAAAASQFPAANADSPWRIPTVCPKGHHVWAFKYRGDASGVYYYTAEPCTSCLPKSAAFCCAPGETLIESRVVRLGERLDALEARVPRVSSSVPSYQYLTNEITNRCSNCNTNSPAVCVACHQKEMSEARGVISDLLTKLIEATKLINSAAPAPVPVNPNARPPAGFHVPEAMGR